MRWRALATSGLVASLYGRGGEFARAWPALLTDTIWVAPSGPTGVGTRARPFTSLEEARDAARLRHAAGRSVVVVLRGGDYPRTSSFVLEAADGGTAAAPALWVAAAGERPRLLGALPVTLTPITTNGPLMDRIPLAVRGLLRAVPVVSAGGSVRGLGDGRRPKLPELFADDGPLEVARWPDSGWRSIAWADSSRGGVVIGLDAPFPTGWGAGLGDLVGYFRWDWSAEHIPLGLTTLGQLSVARGRSLYGWLPGQRVAVVDHPAGLTRPGRYFYDASGGRLIVWPGLRAPRWIGALDAPVIALHGVRHLVLQGLTVGWTGGSGIEMQGCDSVVVDRSAVRYTGGNGIVVRGGHGDRITRTEVVGAGYSAIVLEGGDRATLATGGHVVEDDRILQAGRWWLTARSIWIRGVGQRVAHTEIADAEFEAILAQGNDFVIEANRIHHLLRGSRDAGAIYMGRDWTQRGTVIRRNIFHDIGGLTHLRGNWEVVGVYLDDAISGVTVTENVFLRVPGGIHLGGGRDDLFTRNAFLCTDPAVFLSFRGTWTEPLWHMRDTLIAMGYNRPPYSVRYPALAHILDGDPWAPLGNVIDSNVVTGVMLATDHDRPSPFVARDAMPLAGGCRDTAVDAWIQAATRRSGIPFPLSADVGPRGPVGPGSGAR